MIKRVILFFAKRTHDIRVQLLCATLYGLISIYGMGGAVAIIVKARKLAKPKQIKRKS